MYMGTIAPHECVEWDSIKKLKLNQFAICAMALLQQKT
jgi:hypothetical protein